MYFLAVFTFGLGGDLAARQSPFPARMFTLPVTTRALAGWPMLFGTAAMASLWLVAAPFVRWSWGLDLPLIWPALLGAVFLAWTQVLTWMAYGLPGLRIIAAVLWLAALDAVVILAVQLKVPEPRLVAILAPQLPLAYLAACFVVARARRGDVPDWRGAFARSFRIAPVLSSRQDAVSVADPRPSVVRVAAAGPGPAGARRHPAAVRAGPALPRPPRAAGARRDHPRGRAAHPALPGRFHGRDRRPVGSRWARFVRRDAHGDAAAARAPRSSPPSCRRRSWSTLVAWLLVLVAVPLALALTGTWPVVADGVGEVVEVFGRPRAIVIALLGFTGLLASTWKQLVQSLCIGLTGRAWVDPDERAGSPVVARDRRAARHMDRQKLDGKGGACGSPGPGSSPFWSVSRCPLLPGCSRGSNEAAADRPEPAGPRRLMVDRRDRALRSARVARLHTAAHPALPSRPRRDPGRPPGTTLRRATGPRMEPASGRFQVACGPGDEARPWRTGRW